MDPSQVCCDGVQVQTMDQSIGLAANFLKRFVSVFFCLFSWRWFWGNCRCPSCMANLVSSICQMTCSPTQSTFLEVKTTKVNPENNSTYITALDYYITQDFMDKIYDSCKQVPAFWFKFNQGLIKFLFRCLYHPLDSWQWTWCAGIGVHCVAPRTVGSNIWVPLTRTRLCLFRSITLTLRQPK